MKNKLKNDKRGVVQFIWAGAALVAAGAWLVSVIKPKPVTPTQTIFQSVPVWGWVVMILILLVILRRRN